MFLTKILLNFKCKIQKSKEKSNIKKWEEKWKSKIGECGQKGEKTYDKN